MVVVTRQTGALSEMGGASDSEIPYCYIPPYRNFFCEHYSFCLNAHALRGQGKNGFDCVGCEFITSVVPVDPGEAERAARLLAEVYQTRSDALITHKPTGPLLTKRGGCWRQEDEW